MDVSLRNDEDFAPERVLPYQLHKVKSFKYILLPYAAVIVHLQKIAHYYLPSFIIL